jgi:hypothetical protein
MSYSIRINLLEDTIGHSMTEEAANINFIQTDFFSDLSISGSLIDGEGFGLNRLAGFNAKGKQTYRCGNDRCHEEKVSYYAVI